MKRYYLAYGSNLNLEQMRHRCPDAIKVGTTILNDYQLVFKGRADGYSFLTIEPQNGSKVPVGIYEISLVDEKKLDIYEGYPDSYDKQYMVISLDGKAVSARIYIMQPSYSYHFPSEKYLTTCRKGYHDFGFDLGYLMEALSTTVIYHKQFKR